MPAYTAQCAILPPDAECLSIHIFEGLLKNYNRKKTLWDSLPPAELAGRAEL